MRLLVSLLLATAITNPSQMTVTTNNGVKRPIATKLQETCSVTDFPGLGAGDDSIVFTRAAANCWHVFVPAGTYNTTSTIVVPFGVAFEGESPNSTIIKYSGTGCDVLIDSVQFARVEHLELQTTGSASTVRGLCATATTATFQWNTINDVYILQNNATARVAGQIGLYLAVTSTFGIYSTNWLEIRLNRWDTSVELDGDSSTQPNANTFLVRTYATNVPFFIQRGNDNKIEVHCSTSDGTLITGLQICLTVGDGTNLSSGNVAEVFSDQGATGQGVKLAAVSQSNFVVSDNQSTNADQDLGTTNWLQSIGKNISGLNQRFSIPSIRVTSTFANAGVLLSSSAIQFSAHRAIADTDTVASSGTDYVIGYTSLTASRTVTLPSAAAQGITYIIQDECAAGCASGTIKIRLLAPAGQSVNTTANPSTFDCVTTASGACRVRADGGTHWWVN